MNLMGRIERIEQVMRDHQPATVLSREGRQERIRQMLGKVEKHLPVISDEIEIPRCMPQWRQRRIVQLLRKARGE